jgi:hypothetical protein
LWKIRTELFKTNKAGTSGITIHTSRSVSSYFSQIQRDCANGVKLGI